MSDTGGLPRRGGGAWAGAQPQRRADATAGDAQAWDVAGAPMRINLQESLQSLRLVAGLSQFLRNPDSLQSVFAIAGSLQDSPRELRQQAPTSHKELPRQIPLRHREARLIAPNCKM